MGGESPTVLADPRASAACTPPPPLDRCRAAGAWGGRAVRRGQRAAGAAQTRRPPPPRRRRRPARPAAAAAAAVAEATPPRHDAAPCRRRLARSAVAAAAAAAAGATWERASLRGLQSPLEAQWGGAARAMSLAANQRRRQAAAVAADSAQWQSTLRVRCVGRAEAVPEAASAELRTRRPLGLRLALIAWTAPPAAAVPAAMAPHLRTTGRPRRQPPYRHWSAGAGHAAAAAPVERSGDDQGSHRRQRAAAPPAGPAAAAPVTAHASPAAVRSARWTAAAAAAVRASAAVARRTAAAAGPRAAVVVDPAARPAPGPSHLGRARGATSATSGEETQRPRSRRHSLAIRAAASRSLRGQLQAGAGASLAALAALTPALPPSRGRPREGGTRRSALLFLQRRLRGQTRLLRGGRWRWRHSQCH